MKRPLKKQAAVLFVITICAWIFPLVISAQEIRPATVWQPMPDFSLPSYQGEEISISQLKGKNIILVFPRGLAGEDHWCHVCNYQYAQWFELEKNHQIREKHNLEILFVLPYGKEMVTEWVEKFASQLEDIENWKNPPEQDKLDERGKRRMERIRELLPQSFKYEKDSVPFPFPVLIDTEAKISKGLGVFTKDWGGSKIEQNIPTVYIIDPQGILQLKHISQSTFDRPSPDYLLKFLSFIKKTD